MSWQSALSYAKGIAEKHGLTGDAKQQDVDLPLGARIGGVLQLQKAPFIRAISNGSFIEMPTDVHSVIKAISRVNLNLTGSLYRYYLATGDENEKEVFLQVYVNEQGYVTEAIYCTQLTRLIPETEEDQKIYMGLSGCGLGDKSYSLWRDQLEELGFGEADLHAAFGEYLEIEYHRDSGDPELDFVKPFVGSETRLDDAKGERGLKQDVYFMPYRREISDWDIKGNVEYLLITTELVQSKNGDTSKREIHVDFMVGIPVDVERVLIQ